MSAAVVRSYSGSPKSIAFVRSFMVDLRSTQLDGVAILEAVVEASWRLNRLKVMKVFISRASSWLETSLAAALVASAFAIAASAASLALCAMSALAVNSASDSVVVEPVEIPGVQA